MAVSKKAALVEAAAAPKAVSAVVEGLTIEAPSLDGLVAQVDAQIAAAKLSEQELALEYKLRRGDIRALIRRLEASKRGLRRIPGGKRRSRGTLDPHKQAGPGNLAKLREAASVAGEASQAQLARASGVGTGSMTWAIRALVKDGELVDTGERLDGSRVFRYVRKRGRSRVMQPGAAA